MLQTFLPLFFMTFGICLFIVLMQFIWRFVDDLVGKGLEISVLAELFFYAALSLVPMALPLAILLASLMTFGNLGERLELLAMKSAGVSLIHIMRPLLVLIIGVSIGAFFFQNNVMPVVNVKLYSLIYSMKAKSPELDIPEGAFYNEIKGYNVYVKKKEKDGLLKDVMIYDNSKQFNNTRVIVADSGRFKTSADKLFLVLTLYNGESFENISNETSNNRGQKSVSYRREEFGTKEFLIEFDANFARTDESLLQNQYIGKNLDDLQYSIDSMSVRLDSVKSLNARSIYTSSYKRSFTNTDSSIEDGEKQEINIPKILNSEEARGREDFQLNFDNLYVDQTPGNRAALLNRAKSSVENVRQDYLFRAANVGDEAGRLRRHMTEWHKKFTLSVACIVFFFIGAPLGAIIRKGGLGVPVIISVLLFIFYYIIDNIGFKMAREGVWAAWEGMWLSTAILAPMGVFLTYKAVNDSVILNADTYINAIKNLIGKRSNRKIELKEVIIFTPDYSGIASQLKELISDAVEYLEKHSLWINYFTFWKNGGRDPNSQEIARQLENIVEELSNSDRILVLNKLMDYPVMTGYGQMNIKLNRTIGMIIGLFIPVGLPFYLLAMYKRKLLRHDMNVVVRTSTELLDILPN